MGTDIFGWVEVHDPYTGAWDGIVRINYLVGRTYSMFAALFGVRNDWNFHPAAPSRGVPMDASSEVIAERKRDDLAPSWIVWDEIAKIDWDESVPLTEVETAQEMLMRNVLTPGWDILFRIMQVLAERYGPGRVRLVVWFRSDS